MPKNIPPTPLGIPLTTTASTTKAVEIEVFLDLICPFSARMFGTLCQLPEDLQASVVLHPVIQPWHPQSTLVHEVGLGVLKVCGPSAYRKYVSSVFGAFLDKDAFTDQDTWKKTKSQIYKELLAHVPQDAASKDSIAGLLRVEGEGVTGNGGNEITQDLKWICKHHRKRGVHVTPTVFVNGIEATQISSGWTVDQWKDYFRDCQ